MSTYDLYLESGPRRRKTMGHVLDLLKQRGGRESARPLPRAVRASHYPERYANTASPSSRVVALTR